MASTKDYLDFCLEQLRPLYITYKQMMGEYLLYYNDYLFGGIYDDRLLVKITVTNDSYGMKESIPYPGAKAMYLVSDMDNKDLLKEIVINTVEGLK